MANLTWSTGYRFDMGQCAFVGDYLYVPNYSSNSITQTDLNGNIVQLAWCTGLTQAQACVKYGDYLYVSTGSTISQVLLSDPTVVNTSWATGLVFAYGLTIYGTNLYVVDNGAGGRVSKISLVGGTTQLDWRTVGGSPAGIAIHGTDLYVGNIGGFISKLSLVSTTTDINWMTVFQSTGVAVYGNNLYASSLTVGVVYQISLLDKSTTTWASGFSWTFALVVYNANLYVSYAQNTIAQLALPALPLVCFKEDSKILTDKGYIAIQDLRKGDLVKTLLHDYKPIDMIGKRDIYHSASKERIKDQLYKCSQTEYPEVFEDLIITGCHSILVDGFTSDEQREKVIEVNGDIFGTDNKHRLPACADEKSSVYEIPGKYTIYHLALENENYFGNYGIYANGLLVET